MGNLVVGLLRREADCAPPAPPSTSGVSHLALAAADAKDHKDGSRGRGAKRGSAALRGSPTAQRERAAPRGSLAAPQAQRRDEAAGSLGDDNRQLLPQNQPKRCELLTASVEKKSALNVELLCQAADCARPSPAPCLLPASLPSTSSLSHVTLAAADAKDREEDLKPSVLHSAQDAHPASSSDCHFIEQHREQLIQRTTNVAAVLDMLYGQILDEEQYQKISSRETQKK